jgi:hypothetical protein
MRIMGPPEPVTVTEMARGGSRATASRVGKKDAKPRTSTAQVSGRVREVRRGMAMEKEKRNGEPLTDADER